MKVNRPPGLSIAVVKDGRMVYNVKHRSEGGEVITIRHLLNHSSGLANSRGILGLIHLDGESHPSQVRLAEKLMSANQRLAFEAGTHSRTLALVVR